MILIVVLVLRRLRMEFMLSESSTLILDGVVVSDAWRFLDDDVALGDDASIISVSRLLSDSAYIVGRDSALGVVVCAGGTRAQKLGDDVRVLEPYLNILDLIAIEFPGFRNGRGFSSARILREEFGFAGELRAVGDIHYDQLYFMHRCGFNSFAVRDGLSASDFATMLKTFSLSYQTASDRAIPIFHKRHRR